LKDAVRLLVYFVATILIGALLAPVIYWAGQFIAAHGFFPFLAGIDFERYFRRALIVAAIILLWPLLWSIELRCMRDFELAPNPNWKRDLLAGFLVAGIPLLCFGGMLILVGIYSPQPMINWFAFAKIIPTAIVVPAIEEIFFRGLILGVLLRSGRRYMSILVTSALYSLLHFLKAPEQTSTLVTWTSGFNSIAHSFAQFADPMLVTASFTTLFLIGWILADARMQTRSLWLAIGLHAGWIFVSGTFNRIADLEVVMLPWLGRNLLVGIVPLGVAGLTWLIMRCWLKYVGASKA
jgi:membrane protease YdiL (CAAX protease family)